VSSFLRRVPSFCALSLKASLMITLAPTVVTSLTVQAVCDLEVEIDKSIEFQVVENQKLRHTS